MHCKTQLVPICTELISLFLRLVKIYLNLQKVEHNIWVFIFNHRETYVEREPGEKSNDRNDRAIREATMWYKKHLSDLDTDTTVVLITNDADNKQKAKEKGLTAFTSKYGNLTIL